MIRRSDGIKIYWGYYQDSLVEISGKKIRKKMGETEVAADFQIWSKIKCTCPV